VYVADDFLRFRPGKPRPCGRRVGQATAVRRRLRDRGIPLHRNQTAVDRVLTDVRPLPAMTNRHDLSVLLPFRWNPPTRQPHGRGLPGLKRRKSSATYTPVYATHAPAARSARRPSVERLLSNSFCKHGRAAKFSTIRD
jgi:hypothetical protein